VSARQSIEPNSISFKRGIAAVHHAFMMQCSIVLADRWMDRLPGSIDHWHKSQRSEKLIGATPYATHTLHWSSQVKTAGRPRKISHATAQ
jgi:hypothetical protein